MPPPHELMTEESMDAKVLYDGVVLTTIDVIPDPNNSKRVTFNDNTVGALEDKDAVAERGRAS